MTSFEFVSHITLCIAPHIPSASYNDHTQSRFGCQVLSNHNNGDDDDGDDDPPYCVGCQEIQFLLL